MKKFLAFILSLVLVFALVVAVACNVENFKEVNLEDEETKEEFVNALADKVDIEKLFGDPSKEGWTFGLEQSSKFAFKLDIGHEDDGNGYTLPFSAKADVELSENAKVALKSNGADADPDFAASLSLSAKGNVELSDNIYDLIDIFSDEFASMLGYDYYNLPALVKDVITDFNYGVDAYVDNDVALVSINDGLYNKLPDDVKETLGSNKIRLPLAILEDFAPYAVADTDGVNGYVGLDKEEVKETINYIVDALIAYKVSVAVSNTNGYALKLTATKESILAILGNGTPQQDDNFPDYWFNVASQILRQALSNDSKLEIIVRVDKNGAFNSFSVNYNFNLNLDYEYFDLGKYTGTLSISGSQELKKFTGKVTKPNESQYKLPEAFEGLGDED